MKDSRTTQSQDEDEVARDDSDQPRRKNKRRKSRRSTDNPRKRAASAGGVGAGDAGSSACGSGRGGGGGGGPEVYGVQRSLVLYRCVLLGTYVPGAVQRTWYHCVRYLGYVYTRYWYRYVPNNGESLY